MCFSVTTSGGNQLQCWDQATDTGFQRQLIFLACINSEAVILHSHTPLANNGQQMQRPSLSWFGISSNKNTESLPSLNLLLLGVVSSELPSLQHQASRNGKWPQLSDPYFAQPRVKPPCFFPNSYSFTSTTKIIFTDKTGIIALVLKGLEVSLTIKYRYFRNLDSSPASWKFNASSKEISSLLRISSVA